MKTSRPFYIAVMSALQVSIAYDQPEAIGFGERNRQDDNEHSYLTVRQSLDALPDTARHWCFRADTAQIVREFHSAGLATGGIDAGAPGLRSSYHDAYYAAFLLDPDGNKIEAVCHHGA